MLLGAFSFHAWAELVLSSQLSLGHGNADDMHHNPRASQPAAATTSATASAAAAAKAPASQGPKLVFHLQPVTPFFPAVVLCSRSVTDSDFLVSFDVPQGDDRISFLDAISAAAVTDAADDREQILVGPKMNSF